MKDTPSVLSYDTIIEDNKLLVLQRKVDGRYLVYSLDGDIQDVLNTYYNKYSFSKETLVKMFNRLKERGLGLPLEAEMWMVKNEKYKVVVNNDELFEIREFTRQGKHYLYRLCAAESGLLKLLNDHIKQFRFGNPELMNTKELIAVLNFIKLKKYKLSLETEMWLAKNNIDL